MANQDAPKGFAPYGKVKQVLVLEAGSTIAPGEFIRMASDGQVDAVAAGETILGLALGYAAAAGDKVLCSVDPEQLYVGQCDGSAIDAQTDIGNNVDVLATADNTTYKESRMEMNTSTVAAAAAQLTILGIDPRPDNAFGEFVDVIVRINEHQIMGVDAFGGV